MTRIFALISGITTMTGINSEFDTDIAIKNFSKICGQSLKEIPDWQTIQDVIETLNYDEIDNIRRMTFKALIRSKMFNKYRYNGFIQILVDTTGLSSHDYNLNGNRIAKASKDGKTKYYKYVLEAKAVFGNIVISIDSEWIENNKLNNENDKQDCEINVFKRMAIRLKKNFPKLKFIITEDVLYTTTPMINICKSNKWEYIFNLKKDRLKTVYEIFNDNIFDVFKYVEVKDNKTTIFHYVSNLNIKNSNIEQVVSMGRKRWKIENEGFNIQKNETFNISHLCSRFDNALKIHYLFIQIAHTIRQLLEYDSFLTKLLKIIKKEEISFKILGSRISSIQTNLENLNLNFQLRFDN